MRLGQRDEILELERSTVETVGVPTCQSVDLAVPDGIAQTFVCGPPAPAIGADIVVDEHLRHRPAQAATERPTVLFLACDA